STHPNAKAVCEMGITAYAGQPLISQGRLLGTLSFASLTRTHFTPAEIELLRSTCDQIAIALERANLNASLQQQAEQLRQANRIKDEFLAVLSHELRSPLNPILGWSKLLQTGKLDAVKTAQALATIERNAKLQTELIEDLLDVSKILQGKLSLNIRPVDLALTVESAIETVNLAAVAKSIDIRTVLDPQIGQILGDSGRLQQIVWNLVSNAVKFTSTGGRVEVRLTCVGDRAQITVADTGIGIAREFLPYVFDYFRQKDGATTRNFGGLGLGLAIVRHLVELHGGTVAADSPGEGQGATFTVSLPLSPKVKGQENSLAGFSERSTADEQLSGMRILVVDDEPDMRELISFLLEDAGAEVVTVAVAREALTALARFQPDLLLSDIGMPGMDGYMLLQQVRTLPPERGGLIPAIALTAYAGEFDRQQALQAGFQRHLAKPIEPDELIKTIVALLSKNTDGPASSKD
ncbi:ATP-binding protein, partial [Microcoleus sp. HI-ES]|nr:ATP-binding protein [Microcoleus sp. HI-ES]